MLFRSYDLMIWLIVSVTTFFPPKLSKRKLTPGISMLMPKDFVLMEDDLLASKYNYPHRPTAMYTDKNMVVDAGVNITERYWSGDDIELMLPIYEGSIKSNYTTVKFFQKEIQKINKRTFVVFEFVGKVEQVKKYDKNGKERAPLRKKKPIITYNYIMYTVVSNRIVVVNFNCPDRLRAQWQGTAKKMLQSVQIKNIKQK